MLGTSAIFATYLIITISRRRFFIAMNAAFAGVEAKISPFIAKSVNAAFLLKSKTPTIALAEN